MKVRDLMILLESTALANLDLRFEVLEREGKVTVGTDAGFVDADVRNGELLVRLIVPPLHAEEYRLGRET